MRIGWLRGAALVLAVVLGGASGLGLARLVDAGVGSGPDRDPLRLGVEQVDLGCTGDHIIVIARGETRPALRAAVVGATGARYLDTDASCPTLYAPLDRPVPRYVVYLGPFSTPGRACEIRMTPEHRGDFVTSLQSGNQTYVKCPCELATDGWPVLTPGMDGADATEAMWITQLQKLLVDVGRLREDEQETGRYDAATVAAVRRMQAGAALPVTGIVDAPTWTAIRDRACLNYDY
jgi:hypothetical protein